MITAGPYRAPGVFTMNITEKQYLDYVAALGGLAYYITAVYYVAASFSNTVF